jgi:hypothetical protein
VKKAAGFGGRTFLALTNKQRIPYHRHSRVALVPRL